MEGLHRSERHGPGVVAFRVTGTFGPAKVAGGRSRRAAGSGSFRSMADGGTADVGPTGSRRWGVEGMCDCAANGPARMLMAAVVEGCGDLGAGTPTQYVARWTDVAVVARERGYLAADSVVSFDDAAAVDAARPDIEDAVRTAIASEEACSRRRPGRRRRGSFPGSTGRGDRLAALGRASAARRRARRRCARSSRGRSSTRRGATAARNWSPTVACR